MWWCKRLKRSEDKYLHWWMNTWRCMAFFTVCVLFCVGRHEEDLVTHYSKFSLSGEPLKPNHTRVLSLLQHRNTQRSPLQHSSTWRSALPFPLLSKSSLLFLLLLLELLDGVHLSSGAHLAHRSRVLGLHHQLVGQLIVFLQTRQKRKMKPHNATNHWVKKKKTYQCQKLQLRPLLC